MKQDYMIAGHHIRFRGKNLTKAVTSLPGFDVFAHDGAGEPLCQLMSYGRKLPDFERVRYTSLTELCTSQFGDCRDGYLLNMVPQSGAAPLKMHVAKDGRTARLAGNLDTNMLRLACWIAYGLATMPFRTVAVHTSAVYHSGKAVLFLGESGTGKSTHTRLWRENIEGASLLNDDSPIVRIIDGKPWVYGSPWSGKTPCYKDERYPLAACVRLSQAPANRIRKLSVLQAFAALHPSCPPFFAYDDALYDRISDVLGVLIASVPAYHLACLPNAAAARLSFETIFNPCEK